LPRLGSIAIVFARHGFGEFLDRLNLAEHIPLAKRLAARRAPAVDRGLKTEDRLVHAFQELGTTFVKLGQILASRPDLVGEDFAEAFKRLRDRVRPFDPETARRTIETELRKPLNEIFSSFEDEPAGSGSIAQVHRARLLDGTDVMVKVRRPDIESAILADLALLRLAAGLAEPQLPEMRPTQIVEEFERAMRDELDLTVEASNTARFRAMFRDTEGVRAPAVFWEHTTASVLTLERLDGVSLGDLEELERRGHDRKRLAKALAECFMTQYFREGTFHADPHPGNLLVADDGTIGLVDFGLVGHLSGEIRARLTTILLAAVAEDLDTIAEVTAELGVVGEEFDRREFNRDITALYYKYSGMPLGRTDTRRLFGDMTRVARHNDLALPRDLVMLGKSMATLSSTTRALDPSFDVLRATAPKTQELFKDKLSPGRLAKLAGLNLLTLGHLLRSIPRDVRSIVRKIESGQLQVGFRHRGLGQALNELDRASNRLAISIYVAAVLVASSLMVQAHFLSFRGVSVPGALGYALAGILSLWLAWGILRSGRL